MSDRAATALADLRDELRAASVAEMFYATVVSVTATTVNVRPDSLGVTETGPIRSDIGPIRLVGTRAPAIDDRVCCLRSSSGALACIGRVTT